MEKERDEAKQEVKVAFLAATTADGARARAEENLARVQEALVAAKDDKHKADVETAQPRG